MPKVKCSFCLKEIKIHGIDSDITEDIISKGAVNNFTIGYGSQYDGEMWLLAICDECLTKAVPLKITDYLFRKTDKRYKEFERKEQAP